jgi:dTDP-glucose 4,6-dehydratase
VSSATQAIGEKGKNGEIYHISTERMITIRQLVELICEKMTMPFEQLCEVADDRLGKDSAYLLDSSKVRSDLNWQDKISLEKGIERTIDWVKANFDQLASTPLDYIHKP